MLRMARADLHVHSHASTVTGSMRFLRSRDCYSAPLDVYRVAKARGLSADEVHTRVAAHTSGRTFGVLGEPRVDVLALNLALDRGTR